MAEPAYREVAKIDQEPFYLNAADYRAFAVRTLAERKQLMEELGLAQE